MGMPDIVLIRKEVVRLKRIVQITPSDINAIVIVRDERTPLPFMLSALRT